jgi:hypothetical protein
LLADPTGAEACRSLSEKYSTETRKKNQEGFVIFTFFCTSFLFQCLELQKITPPFVKIIAGMGKSFSPQQGYEDSLL